ncbi:MAG: hypothetical protein H6713_24840 [Myxococcales bacterium]|nr:hypothetical protein [Myxococcales bacterium]
MSRDLDTPQERRARRRLLIIGLALLNLELVLADLIISRFEMLWTLVGYVALALALFAVVRAVDRRYVARWPDIDAGPFLGVALVLAMFLSLLPGAFWIPEYLTLMTGGEQRELAVASAPEHAGAGYRQFDGGALRPDLLTEHEVAYRRGDASSRTLYRIAPIVPPGWTSADPVPLWAGTTSTRFSFAEWARHERPLQGVLEIKDLHYRRAIKWAGAQHGLEEQAGAPVLRLQLRTYAELRRDAALKSWLLLALANAAWAWFFVWFGGLDRARGRARR